MSLHRAMLIVILIAGFGLGLALPTIRRHVDENHARQALQTLQALAQAEKAYFEKNGFYTADFTDFLPLGKCESSVEKKQSVLACPGYTIQLEEAQVLRAQSTKYPQWFKVGLDGGSTACEYEDGSLVGPKICKVVYL